jgi:ubiquitin-like protein ATG12
MKQNFFRVTVSNRFQAVIQFLRKELNWKAGEPLVSQFLNWIVHGLRPALRGRSLCDASDLIIISSQFTYINLAFSPAPDDTIANLYRVSPVACSSRRAETNTSTVVRDGWTPHSKL